MSKEGFYQIKVVCDNCGDVFQDYVDKGKTRPRKVICRTCECSADTYPTGAQ